MGKRAHLPGIPARLRRALAPLAAALRRLGPVTPAKAAFGASALAALGLLAALAWAASDSDNPEAVAQPSATATAPATPRPTPKAPPKPTPTVTVQPTALPVKELTIGPGQTARYLQGLYRVTPDGTASLVTTRTAPGASFGFYSVSHDERWIAFPEGDAVYVKDRETPGPARPVASLGDVWSVELSPTGDKAIVYARVSGNEGSFLLDMTNGSYTRFQAEGLIMRGAVWSPDGHRIAFIAGPHGETHTYVVSPDGTGLKLLSTGSGFLEWSPDSRSIALDGRIVIDVETAESIALSEPFPISSPPGSNSVVSGDPSWSLDGRRLAFSASRPDGTGVNEIHLVELQTGQEMIVAAGSSPALSADGSKIAFTRDGNLYVVNADGSSERQLIFPTQPFAERPTWLADDSLMFNFSSLGASVYVINADGSGEANIADGFSPEWSPDGGLIAFIGGGTGPNLSGRSDIYVMHPDGGGVRKVGDYNWNDEIGQCEGEEGQSWSPDGQLLAFDDTSNGEVKVVSINDGQPPDIVADGYSPAWSPDGLSLAFITDEFREPIPSDPDPEEINPCSLYVAPANDPGDKRLAFDKPAQSFSWAPDGQRIAFADNSRLSIGHLQTGAVSVIATNLSKDPFMAPSVLTWSPDGTRVMYLVRGELYVIDAAGGTPVRIDRSNAPNEGVQGADWSPDGTRIVFSAAYYDATIYESYIYIADAYGGEIKRLTEGSDPDWSPDGTRIAFIR